MADKTEKIAKNMGENKPSAVLSFVDFWLDDYEDIFSDFDPSPYSKRTISEDFITEMMRRFPELREHFEIRMSVPQQLRSAKDEATIRRRLKDYFSKMKKKAEEKIRRERKRGAIYFVGGFMVLALLLVLESAEAPVSVKLLSLVLAPLGWFGVWEGTRHLIEGPEEYVKKTKLYKALSEARYGFFSEQELTGMVMEAEKKQLAGKKK
jgi:hypothetical protein